MNTQSASESMPLRGILKETWSILLPQDRRALAQVGVVSALAALGEAIGLGAVIPLLTVIASPDWQAASPRISSLIRSVGIESIQSQTLVVIAALLVVFTLKTSLMGFAVWRQGRFVYEIVASTGNRLYAGLLRQPWTAFSSRNSADVIHALTVDTRRAVEVIVSMLVVFTETLVLLSISSVLLWLEPLGTLVIGTALVAAAWAFNRATTARIKAWGMNRQRREVELLREVQHGLGGGREVRIFSMEGVFARRYEAHAAEISRICRRQHFVTALPRLWFELLAVTAVSVLLSLLVLKGQAIDDVVPTMGMFVAGGLRMLPSIMRIVTGIQIIRGSGPAVRNLTKELMLVEQVCGFSDESRVPPRAGPDGSSAIKLDGVWFRYPSSQSWTLQGISLQIERGTRLGVIGSSGSGKSTLVDLLIGLLTPTTGCVLLGDADLSARPEARRTSVGYVPQSIFLLDDSIARNVAFGYQGEDIDSQRVSDALRDAQLADFVQSLPEGIGTRVGERGARLSGGQRQRIGIARALYRKPSVLVLDEATSALDVPTEREFMKAVFSLERDKTVIIVAHRLETLKQCDFVCRIEGGRVVAYGRYEEVISDAR
jgi:ABC-type multidrug transport system fused ATPase/permease subunit